MLLNISAKFWRIFESGLTSYRAVTRVVVLAVSNLAARGGGGVARGRELAPRLVERRLGLFAACVATKLHDAFKMRCAQREAGVFLNILPKFRRNSRPA